MSLTTEMTGKEVMVPLTGSMYVPGKLSDTAELIVDVGAGYMVTKSPKDAAAHFNDKVRLCNYLVVDRLNAGT